MNIYLILAIVFAILLIVFIIKGEAYGNKGSIIGVMICAIFYGAFIVMAYYEKEPTALDVYRGKTTLEITYRDSVAVDSVVYKIR